MVDRLVWALLAGTASITWVLASAAGGDTASFEELTMAAHHYAHIGLPTAAFVIFSVGVLREVRQRGWPAFSWHL